MYSQQIGGMMKTHAHSHIHTTHTPSEDGQSCMQFVSTPLWLLTFPSWRNRTEKWRQSCVDSADTFVLFIYTHVIKLSLVLKTNIELQHCLFLDCNPDFKKRLFCKLLIYSAARSIWLSPERFSVTCCSSYSLSKLRLHMSIYLKELSHLTGLVRTNSDANPQVGVVRFLYWSTELKLNNWTHKKEGLGLFPDRPLCILFGSIVGLFWWQMCDFTTIINNFYYYYY